ncbi:hypothetical protein ACWIYZ_11295 [Ursidibacter arcticus]
MRNFLIKLLGGITKTEHLYRIETINQKIELNYIHRWNLEFASTLLTRWNAYRSSINTLAKEVLKNNPDYFNNNSSLLHDLVLQDYYFRRLFLLQNKKDFFEEVEENRDNFHKRGYGILGKAFWEIEPKFFDLIYSDKYLKNWSKINF